MLDSCLAPGLAPKVKLVSIAAGTHHCILEAPELASKEVADFFKADTKALEKWGEQDRVSWPIGWYLLHLCELGKGFLSKVLSSIYIYINLVIH